MCAHEIGKHTPSTVSSLSLCADVTATITITLFLLQVWPHCKVTIVRFTSTAAVAPNGSNVTQSSRCVSF